MKIKCSKVWKFMIFYTYLEAEEFIKEDEHHEYKEPIFLPDGKWRVEFMRREYCHD